jgi:hypothetical protein
MTNECIPLHEGPYTRVITVHISTTGVTGKCFVGPITGRQSGGLAGLAADPLAAGDGSNYTVAGPPAAGGKVLGVSSWDVASSGKAAIISGAGTILPVTSGAAITIGWELAVDNTGKVVHATTGNVIVGRALTAAGGSGVDVEVELYANDDNNLSP